MQVPTPTFCPMCRAQRRFSFRNERNLYKRKSDLSGKDIFSTFSAQVPFPVYTQEEWFSDAWDPISYGREYDFSRPFFEQFKALSDVVPKPGKSAIGFVNSDYCNNASYIKNCYLVFNGREDEDCAYSNVIISSRNCFDNLNILKSELCYENFRLGFCNRVFFSSGIQTSTDIWFSKNLWDCSYCFGCVNLRGKKYHIFNEPFSQSEYEKKIIEFNLGSYQALKAISQESREFWLRFPNKFREGIKNTNVRGEYIYNSKNVLDTYQAIGGEDLRYCQFVNYGPTKDTYDHSVFGYTTELSYENAMVGDQAYNNKFNLQCYPNVKNLEYCEYCTSSSDLFGCVGLKKKQFCILNKQYSKEEYESLVLKIREHMSKMPYIDANGRSYAYGEFFPSEFSPFSYNETLAQEHFPFTKDQAIAEKKKWHDFEAREYKITSPAADLPDHINNVDQSILNEIIGCAHGGSCNHGCTKAFRLIPQEAEFYKRFFIPLPRLCFSCRHGERSEMRNSLYLHERRCQCSGEKDDLNIYRNTATHFHGVNHCPNEFETSYAPDRKEIVYCESCYQSEVM